MTHIAAVRCAFPPNRYAQAELTDMAARVCLPPDADRRLLDRLHRSARVEYRNLALPIEDYEKLDGFGAANDAYVTAAVELGRESVRAALDGAGLVPSDVDMIMFTSVTGIAVPSIDARLVGALGLRPDVKRLPVFGLGCVAGAAGIARLHDYLRGWPDHVAVLLSVELCSLTVQRGDGSPAGLVASALFGDGAAAVVACGDGRAPDETDDPASDTAAGPVVVATRSHLYPDSEHVMGWQVGGDGLRVVLDAGVPEVVRRYLADDVYAFLGDHGVTAGEVTAWVCHPGGPKVLEAVSDVLDLPPGALDVTWRSLAAHGNLSSSSVLHVLGETLATRRPEPGTWGVLIAMGPGFCSELVLLRW
ncbi:MULTISPECIES: type III polyketide synthase [Nonomuraea]|uniref:Type III polyketide synthase n=1 Tax=Nonomuraea ferruginea TaxID=46174 RepID=A0ABT4T5B6_9ACTN|nr:3-oxoacyl-[acyl-carrier-protein] synthase III C-terminal domain-containing protein [Nonomuraea ferruginea]MDA0644694.1 type III polyketide synthase [Nonomuraea ferruginea]